MSDTTFSFGTLRVQAGLFGRAVPTVADALLGFRLGTLEIHPSLERTASGRAASVSLPR